MRLLGIDNKRIGIVHDIYMTVYHILRHLIARLEHRPYARAERDLPERPGKKPAEISQKCKKNCGNHLIISPYNLKFS